MVYKRIEYEDLKANLGQYVDLATSAMGGSIVAVTDEFFAPATRMISPTPALHAPGKHCETGHWMDGWETKRHNRSYDWCIVKLGVSGSIRGFDIDTSWFTGNQAPAASVDAAFIPEGGNIDDAQWVEILPRVDLPPTCHNVFVLEKETAVYTHVRINNHPDGGIARFRVYGQVTPQWSQNINEVVDLAFVGNGGRVVYATNEHYAPANNVLLPGNGENADDGWQTKRSRIPGHSDQIVIKLGDKGHIFKIELDTTHFKGNYPDKFKVEGTNTNNEIPSNDAEWTTILTPSSTGPHSQFYFDAIHHDQVYSHARVSIIPDGGFKRVRLYGIRQGGQIPSLPLSNFPFSSIIAEPLTAEKYAPFGEVIEARQTNKVTSANQGTASKHHHVAKVTNAFPNNSGKVNLCVFRSAPTKQLPFVVKMFERHPYSSQQFIPMTHGQTRGYLVVVCLNKEDGSPDLSTIRAFVASPTQGISYRQGVWHHPMVTLDGVTDFACLVHENDVDNDNCQEAYVDKVIVHVPGFHGNAKI
ncbi:hypothetical protein INT45_012582 [Circinella minor]|uniref:Allantoicase domain-containing protein n=1 Tax=Circinella minor TaxID=1195481 RepID=A0A8H7RU99_9FUNG|nr:hypothetical protein INT45_012582 [Circinella minor]